MNVHEGAMRKNITTTDTSIRAPTGGGGLYLLGVLVSQASSTPTLKVADADGIIMNTITPTAGQFYPMPCQLSGTLTVTISGTVDCTVFYGPNP